MMMSLEETQAAIRILDPDTPGICGCPFCPFVNTYAEVGEHIEADHKAEAANWAVTNHGDELIVALTGGQ